MTLCSIFSKSSEHTRMYQQINLLNPSSLSYRSIPLDEIKRHVTNLHTLKIDDARGSKRKRQPVFTKRTQWWRQNTCQRDLERGSQTRSSSGTKIISKVSHVYQLTLTFVSANLGCFGNDRRLARRLTLYAPIMYKIFTPAHVPFFKKLYGGIFLTWSLP